MRAYVHVPFCRQKCGYCKFALTPFVRAGQVERYFAALDAEISEFLRTEAASSLQTLYFGGGTPSAVPAEFLAAVIGRFELAPDAEITAEANPEDLTPDLCRQWKDMGVTRLSVGVQSLDDAVLATVGRKGSGATLRGLSNAFSVGFSNVGTDLILGLPREAPGGTMAALRRLHAEFPLAHVSLYLLEAGTYPRDWRDLSADVESVRSEFLECRDFLMSQKGFVHYEVSNFARRGFESVHNRAYWERHDVRGFGLSAASLWKGRRFENAASFVPYFRGERGAEETLTPEQERLESLLCGMRTFALDPNLVENRAELESFKAQGLLVEVDGRVFPTSA